MPHWFDKNFLLLAVLFAGFFGGALYFQKDQIDSVARYGTYRDSLYLPRESEYVELFSLGYDMIMADVLWLRSIQAFGGHWTSDRNYDSIFNMFNVITDLDPRFIDAYLFGNMVIGEEAGHPELALELINKGIVRSLNSTYQLGYFGGYFSYWNYGDPERARWYYTMAMRADDCPDFVERIIGYMEMKSGRYHVAFQKYVTDYLRASDNKDNIGMEINRTKLRDVLGDWFMADLERAAQEFEAAEGRGPQLLEELVLKGYFEPIDAYDLDKFWSIVDESEMKGEAMLPRADEILAQIKRVYDAPPTEPHGYWYFINPALAGEGRYIVNAFTIHERLREILIPSARRQIQAHYAEHGQYPALDEIFGGDLMADPFGVPWIYNRVTGQLKCATFPNL